MNNEKTEVPVIPVEQAADLQALQMAAALDTGPGAPVAEPEAPKLAEELKGLVLAFVAVASPLLPSLGRIYTEETTGAAAAAVGAVCEKRGWLSGGILGEWGEEVAAALVLLPLGYATYQGVKGDLSALDAARVKEKAQVPIIGAAATVGDDGAVNQKTVSFGAPIPAGAE